MPPLTKASWQPTVLRPPDSANIAVTEKKCGLWPGPFKQIAKSSLAADLRAIAILGYNGGQLNESAMSFTFDHRHDSKHVDQPAAALARASRACRLAAFRRYL
jgi:hypothetical protein